MEIFENAGGFAEVLRDLNEAGLVNIILGDGGETTFTLSAAITEAGHDAIAALLAGIETISDPRHRA